MRTSPRHYFNDISFTSLPFFIGCSIFICVFYMVLFVKKFAFITPVMLLLALYILILFLLDWFDDVVYESHLGGRYNRKLRSALVCGFTLFLISEVLLFGGFFWAYFDRVYNPGYITGSFCIPSGTENIDFMRWPLAGTFALVTSGYFANSSYYALRAGSYMHCVAFGEVTVTLAAAFLFIQLAEYNGLKLTISDNVYGSFFYLLTGFHGFHVTVGLLFLCEQYSRLDTDHDDRRNDDYGEYDPRCPRRESIFTPIGAKESIYVGARDRRVLRLNPNRYRHTGLAFALIYWHFVDIIWLFLFANVYVYNNISIGVWLDSVISYVATEEMVSAMIKDQEWTFLAPGANGFRPSYILPRISVT